MKLTFFAIWGILFVLGWMSCKDKITNQIVIPDELTVTSREQKLTEVGWTAFENGDFASAKDNFLAAIDVNSFYADAYNGLGWVYSRLDSLELSRKYFTLGRNSATTDDLFQDASAGRSFVNLALDYYNAAIADVRYALNLDWYYYEEYVFRHDLSITEMDLLLVAAESHFLMEEYQYCYETLMLIDDSLEIDASNPEELATAIENLRGWV